MEWGSDQGEPDLIDFMTRSPVIWQTDSHNVC